MRSGFTECWRGDEKMASNGVCARLRDRSPVALPRGGTMCDVSAGSHIAGGSADGGGVSGGYSVPARGTVSGLRNDCDNRGSEVSSAMIRGARTHLAQSTIKA